MLVFGVGGFRCIRWEDDDLKPGNGEGYVAFHHCFRRKPGVEIECFTSELGESLPSGTLFSGKSRVTWVFQAESIDRNVRETSSGIDGEKCSRRVVNTLERIICVACKETSCGCLTEEEL
ncbi:hypothetical protein NET03_01725 [Thermomicrobium sp. CFH 73360]|uniref:hypothetical protein n=1 Tax=Thermomicrobium sp. CFH 73360 TaxID=2951987 RepID=UPI0020768D73|nr:hypothetical protein [Thermomicrobium sp. CFH 73360]MCM8745243.1 hypothetical protein [Thermomicrobium sp. CFH 73360]